MQDLPRGRVAYHEDLGWAAGWPEVEGGTVNNDVRQVLMNELGLTRESVREEAGAIIKETVDRRFNEDWMRQLEDRIVNRILWQAGRGDIASMVQRATDRAVNKVADGMAAEMVKQIVVSVKLREDV